jgi:hypothetical protein
MSSAAGRIVLGLLAAPFGGCAEGEAPEPDHGENGADEVVPIAWASFDAPPPRDAGALRMRAILANANRYALTTWYDAKGFDDQHGAYLQLGGTEEDQIRPVASEAFALAVALRLGAYDEAGTGAPVRVAEERAVRLLGAVSASHRSNRDGGWGGGWQTALWAAYAGSAGWLLWDRLTPTDAEHVARMVQSEARQLVGALVPYYRTSDGRIVFPGDSKAEENAWNAQLLFLAVAMMPNSEQAPAWHYKATELAVSAFARPEDLLATHPVSGRPLGHWLAGSNANPDGTVINHGIVHPDYIATAAYVASAPLWYGLRRRPTPEAMFEGIDHAYAALAAVWWEPGTTYAGTSCVLTTCECDAELGCAVAAPGGTIYVPGSPDIYFPHGTDWGTGRRMDFALFDALADAFQLAIPTAVRAAEWEALHAGAVLARQLESSDGRAYAAADGDSYPGREEWVAAHAAMAWFAKFVVAQGAYVRSGEFVDVVIDNRDREFSVEEGEWSTSKTNGSLGPDHRRTTPEDAARGARVRWSPRLPAGTYAIHAWWRAGVELTAQAIYEVRHGGGSSRVPIDQRNGGDRWVRLGTFVLDGTASMGTVELTGPAGDGELAADALLFERRGG